MIATMVPAVSALEPFAASLFEELAAAAAEHSVELAGKLSEADIAFLRADWRSTARAEQLPPPGDWRVWLILAGRGFGKTRSGAEWTDALARSRPGIRIALVGASQDDVRDVMIEGESGILSCAREKTPPVWHPSLKRLMWPGGSMASCYSAAEPEGLRGPQHHIAWCDEVARWDASGGREGAAREAGGEGLTPRTRGGAAWDNLLMGMRLGARPQVCATTTPRNLPLVHRILASSGLVRSRGSTMANAGNLPAAWIDAMHDTYGATLIGRQEIAGELIAEVPGALWTRRLLARCRWSLSPAAPGGLSRSQAESFPAAPDGLCPRTSSIPRRQADAAGVNTEVGELRDLFSRIVIGVDPPASSTGDACGIVVVGALARTEGDGTDYIVLADASVEKASPERWARGVAEAAMRWGAARIVAEANNGGEMVRRVLEAEDAELPVKLVHARLSKASRAEPIAHAYARGRVRHAGVFQALEDELCGLQIGGAYCGPGRSPDRADALVWALLELTDRAGAAGPRVRIL